uniref:NECAP endocytosis associated 2 n=1 Tax=Suricata suricatta TaxID=37032 RepID=A0A673T6E0_SURSU
MEEGEYESVLCVKPEVHVYRIPPRATNRGYRAAEWQLDQPSWSGRLRITAKGQVAYIKLEDRTSGDLFAQAPVEQFPGTAVESVTDSSRYFVIRIEDGNGRRAFIGIGFGDRGDAFDFNVALQDHFKWVRQQCEFAKQAQNPDLGPKLDLGFKEGQTIKLSIANMKKKEGAAGTPRARPASTGGLSLLPPPPGGKASTLIPPPGEQLSAGGSLGQTAVAPGSAGRGCNLFVAVRPSARGDLALRLLGVCGAGGDGDTVCSCRPLVSSRREESWAQRPHVWVHLLPASRVWGGVTEKVGLNWASKEGVWGRGCLVLQRERV